MFVTSNEHVSSSKAISTAGGVVKKPSKPTRLLSSKPSFDETRSSSSTVPFSSPQIQAAESIPIRITAGISMVTEKKKISIKLLSVSLDETESHVIIRAMSKLKVHGAPENCRLVGQDSRAIVRFSDNLVTLPSQEDGLAPPLFLLENYGPQLFNQILPTAKLRYLRAKSLGAHDMPSSPTDKKQSSFPNLTLINDLEDEDNENENGGVGSGGDGDGDGKTVVGKANSTESLLTVLASTNMTDV